MARQYIPLTLKRIVADRANLACEYCRSQSKYSPDNLVVDHIIPLSRGGLTVSENLALACQRCNNHKYNKIEVYDEVSTQIVLLFHPRQMSWHEHFIWSDDKTLMLGTTPTGRVTVALLRTNREGLVNLRNVLIERGEHPPL